jgi:hypothetical protein
LLTNRSAIRLNSLQMVFEASIAKIAEDISDSFAEEVSRSIGMIISEENDFAYKELQIPTVRANI